MDRLERQFRERVASLVDSVRRGEFPCTASTTIAPAGASFARCAREPGPLARQDLAAVHGAGVMTGAAAAEPRYTDQQRRAIQTATSRSRFRAAPAAVRRSCWPRGPCRTSIRACPARATQQLSHLIAVTFTERGAREIADRIRRKCHERLINSDGAEADHWAALVPRSTGADHTIHSFCG